jgi:UDP-N-acetylmuramate dehydrogenase
MSSSLILQENVRLAPYTTFQIGGPARWFAEARSEKDIVAAVRFADDRAMPLFVLGGGSNLLVADAGFDGLVLHIALRGTSEEVGVCNVAAGENWDELVTFAVERSLGGIECLAGIPGTVGGTPVQNVGAYGQEVSQTIRQVRVYDRTSGDFHELSGADCKFGYRTSIFNSSAPGRYIVTAVTYALHPFAEPQLGYADLKSYFRDADRRPSLLEVADAVREVRRRKGMLLTEGDPDCRSAGSFFKNPVVAVTRVEAIAVALGIDESQVPRYPAAYGNVKLPAAWLLEQAGFHKGFSLGAAGISTRHTLALTNRGGAKAADILALRDQIVEGVNGRFGIRLEPEPVVLA